jgi:predicted nuclease of predicted toxin-antitoxin system
LKFLIDMPITPAAVARLEDHGHDAVHASNVGLSRAKDPEILSFARREGRIVVTADLDYPRLLAIQRADSPGVLLFRGGSYSDEQVLRLLERVLLQSKPADLERSVTVVDLTRVRRHRLPIDG